MIVTVNREYTNNDDEGKGYKIKLKEYVCYFPQVAGDSIGSCNAYVAFFNDVFDAVAEVSLTRPRGRMMIIDIDKNSKDTSDNKAVMMAIAIVGREFSFCMKVL